MFCPLSIQFLDAYTHLLHTLSLFYPVLYLLSPPPALTPPLFPLSPLSPHPLYPTVSPPGRRPVRTSVWLRTCMRSMLLCKMREDVSLLQVGDHLSQTSYIPPSQPPDSTIHILIKPSLTQTTSSFCCCCRYCCYYCCCCFRSRARSPGSPISCMRGSTRTWAGPRSLVAPSWPPTKPW